MEPIRIFSEVELGQIAWLQYDEDRQILYVHIRGTGTRRIGNIARVEAQTILADDNPFEIYTSLYAAQAKRTLSLSLCYSCPHLLDLDCCSAPPGHRPKRDTEQYNYEGRWEMFHALDDWVDGV